MHPAKLFFGVSRPKRWRFKGAQQVAGSINWDDDAAFEARETNPPKLAGPLDLI